MSARGKLKKSMDKIRFQQEKQAWLERFSNQIEKLELSKEEIKQLAKYDYSLFANYINRVFIKRYNHSVSIRPNYCYSCLINAAFAKFYKDGVEVKDKLWKYRDLTVENDPVSEEEVLEATGGLIKHC
jgi:hypothetical protein